MRRRRLGHARRWSPATVGLATARWRSGDGSVVDWDQFVEAAAARRGDARLGTLAGCDSGCVAAVGPGAALAAARPDGTLAAYATLEEFVGRGLATACPITLIDAGDLTGRADPPPWPPTRREP